MKRIIVFVITLFPLLAYAKVEVCYPDYYDPKYIDISKYFEDLPPTAAGPVKAQEPIAQIPIYQRYPAFTSVVVTPGAGGGCTGSKC